MLKFAMPAFAQQRNLSLYDPGVMPAAGPGDLRRDERLHAETDAVDPGALPAGNFHGSMSPGDASRVASAQGRPGTSDKRRSRRSGSIALAFHRRGRGSWGRQRQSVRGDFGVNRPEIAIFEGGGEGDGGEVAVSTLLAAEGVRDVNAPAWRT